MYKGLINGSWIVVKMNDLTYAPHQQQFVNSSLYYYNKYTEDTIQKK